MAPITFDVAKRMRDMTRSILRRKRQTSFPPGRHLLSAYDEQWMGHILPTSTAQRYSAQKRECPDRLHMRRPFGDEPSATQSRRTRPGPVAGSTSPPSCIVMRVAAGATMPGHFPIASVACPDGATAAAPC
ncbi:hypothetical protein A0H81_13537 [Grifola frondosa]|uniref:Uncharacterized protein n=1 Tax=Grifola frondosa TaxID=5627 RepID=A0A1C7LPF7_GRIFR|nr:hypothetical protein A0H81_13537 [Grifola frondosa]